MEKQKNELSKPKRKTTEFGFKKAIYTCMQKGMSKSEAIDWVSARTEVYTKEETARYQDEQKEKARQNIQKAVSDGFFSEEEITQFEGQSSN